MPAEKGENDVDGFVCARAHPSMDVSGMVCLEKINHLEDTLVSSEVWGTLAAN
jgi:hypothetical protein